MDPEILRRIKQGLVDTKRQVLGVGRGLFNFGSEVVQDIQTNPIEALTVVGDIEANLLGQELSREGHPFIGAGLQALGAGGAALTALPIAGSVANVAQRRAVRAARQLLPEATDTGERAVVRHFGAGAKADVLDPAFMGTGRPGAERAVQAASEPGEFTERTFFYGPRYDKPVEPQFMHDPFVETEINYGSIVKPEDAEPFIEQARREFAEEGRPAVGAPFSNRIDEIIKERGFEGYEGPSGAIVKFTPTELPRGRANREIVEATTDPEIGGATFSTDHENLFGQPLTSVALRPGDDRVVDELTTEVLETFRRDFADDLARPEAAIGTWARDDGKIVLDVVETLEDQAEAIRRGRARGQDGVFDLGTGEFIETPKLDTPTTVTLERVPPVDVATAESALEKTGRADLINTSERQAWLEQSPHDPRYVDIYDTNVGGFVTDADKSRLADVIDDFATTRRVIPEFPPAENGLQRPDPALLRTAAQITEATPEARVDTHLMLVGEPSRMDLMVNSARAGDSAAADQLSAIRQAYEPVRQQLREQFGDKVTLYRFTDPEIEYADKSTQLYTSAEFSKGFAAEGRVPEAVEVSVDDIISAPTRGQYHEFVVELDAPTRATDDLPFLEGTEQFGAKGESFGFDEGGLSVAGSYDPETGIVTVGNVQGGRNEIGVGPLRQALRRIKAEFPEATKIEGLRTTQGGLRQGRSTSHTIQRPNTTTKDALDQEFIRFDSPEELDEFYGIDVEDLGGGDVESRFRGSGYSGTQCTGYACAVKDKLGEGRVQVRGFFEGDNPGTIFSGRDPQFDPVADGHDFAVVDDRYIVDPWLTEFVPGMERGVYDMMDPTDRDMIERIYGNPDLWSEMDVPARAQVPSPDELFSAGTESVDEYLDFVAGGGRQLPERPVTATQAAKARLKHDNRNQANRAARREAIESGLTEQELARLTGGNKRLQKTVEDNYSLLPTPEVFAQAAIRGAESRGWYQGSGEAIKEAFAEQAPRFTALLAAMSPQKSVEENLRIALRTWGDWNRAGRPTNEAGMRAAIHSNLEADIGNAMRALRASDEVLASGEPTLLNGPKVGPFYANLHGLVDPVVNDTHMARGYGTDPGGVGTAGRTLAQNAMVRNAAKEFERITGRAVTAREVQEMSWAYIRGLTNAAGKKGGALETIEQAFLEPGAKFAGGQEVSDRIRNSVSIGHLMADPAFADDLARAGIQAPTPRSPVGTPEVDPQSADINALRDIAERIDLVRSGKPLFSAGPVGLFGIANAKQRFERERERR